jgi:hypothetical protein
LGLFLANYQEPITKNLFKQLLVVKDRPLHNFFALERISNSTICSPLSQAKITPPNSLHKIKIAMKPGRAGYPLSLMKQQTRLAAGRLLGAWGFLIGWL